MNTELTQPILQYPTDLVFAVTDKNALQLLTVLKTEEIHVDDYLIHFAIIGESHCISIYHQDTLLKQEILACTDIPAILQADSHKFAKLESYDRSEHNYRARVWFSDKLQLSSLENEHVLKLDFPEMFGEVPFTQIQWQSSDTQIHWQTTHVYPLGTHTTYVYTESFFDLTQEEHQ